MVEHLRRPWPNHNSMVAQALGMLEVPTLEAFPKHGDEALSAMD